MGDVTRVLITGASGFVGRACVREARARGLEVIALYRSAPLADWQGDAQIRPVQIDLAHADQTSALKTLVQDADAVIHAAAHLGDDPARLSADTSQATRRVLDALEGSAARLVLVSSIVVYDTMQLSPGDMLDEASPIGTPQTARDAYTRGKLEQEEQVRSSGRDAWAIRPGAVWGPGRTWNALLGFWASKLFVQIGSDGELPLVHVDHLALMLVDAAMTPVAGMQALNALDDDRPTRGRFVAAHRRAARWPRLVLRIPYGLWLAGVRLLRPASGKLPGLFREPILRARLMPLRYSNAALRAALGGQDSAPFEAMLDRAVTEGNT